jgi:hypothetical protein
VTTESETGNRLYEEAGQLVPPFSRPPGATGPLSLDEVQMFVDEIRSVVLALLERIEYPVDLSIRYADMSILLAQLSMALRVFTQITCKLGAPVDVGAALDPKSGVVIGRVGRLMITYTAGSKPAVEIKDLLQNTSLTLPCGDGGLTEEQLEDVKTFADAQTVVTPIRRKLF